MSSQSHPNIAMAQDKVDGVKRSHTTDHINEILFSDDEELLAPTSSKVEKIETKHKSTKKTGKSKAPGAPRKSSRKTTKENKTDIMDFSD